MQVTTAAKSLEWLVTRFGIEGAGVVKRAAFEGYGVELVVSPDRLNETFIIYKHDLNRYKPRTRLGVFDTGEEAVDMLKLLLATERNDDGNPDQPD